MELGMLWFDNDLIYSFERRLLRAAAYYERKYEQKPNICYVHTSMSKKQKVEGIQVIPYRSILINHFWIGVDEERKENGSGSTSNN